MPMVRPKPRQVSQAPTGELNENRLGMGSRARGRSGRSEARWSISSNRGFAAGLRRRLRTRLRGRAHAQCGFQGFEDSAAFGGAGFEAVLDDLQVFERGIVFFGAAFTRSLWGCGLLALARRSEAHFCIGHSRSARVRAAATLRAAAGAGSGCSNPLRPRVEESV